MNEKTALRAIRAKQWQSEELKAKAERECKQYFRAKREAAKLEAKEQAKADAISFARRAKVRELRNEAHGLREARKEGEKVRHERLFRERHGESGFSIPPLPELPEVKVPEGAKEAKASSPKPKPIIKISGFLRVGADLDRWQSGEPIERRLLNGQVERIEYANLSAMRRELAELEALPTQSRTERRRARQLAHYLARHEQGVREELHAEQARVKARAERLALKELAELRKAAIQLARPEPNALIETIAKSF